MPSMREIKRRRERIGNTLQITKAMKLVSSVKLQKLRKQTEEGMPYVQQLYELMQALPEGDMLQVRQNKPVQKKLVVVMSSDRGLVAGHHINLINQVLAQPWTTEKLECLSLGKKGEELLRLKGLLVRNYCSEPVEQMTRKELKGLGEKLVQWYRSGQYEEIYLAYTLFKNAIVQVPTVQCILPFGKKEREAKDYMEFEPSAEVVLEEIVPKYVSSLLYGAWLQAQTSESSARMQAMDTATKNAEELMEQLLLQYNRGRQSAITKELTEIVAGAESM